MLYYYSKLILYFKESSYFNSLIQYAIIYDDDNIINN